MAEVEQLIRRLYLPGSPAEIARIQETLQTLQKSSDGWQLADALLGSNDEKVRFFGALTFTVKLNADWETLDSGAAQTILYRLLQHLIRLTSSCEGQLVTKKLISTLVVSFLRFPSQWSHSIRHVAACFAKDEVVPLDPSGQLSPLDTVRSQMSSDQVTAALWFAGMLAEEVGKTDSGSIKDYKYHEIMMLNVEDAVGLIRYALEHVHSELAGEERTAKMTNEAIKCFQSWVFYSQRVSTESSARMESLASLTQQALSCVVVEALFDTTVELLIDILTNYPSFLTANDLAALSCLLRSPWAQAWMARLQKGDFSFEPLQFGRLLLAFGDATLQDFATHPDREDSGHLMAMLHALLTCEGLAVAEDEICVLALEFWSALVEFAVCALFDEAEDVTLWLDNTRGHIVQVIQECWRKIRISDLNEVTTWDADFRAGFKDFRKDVADLLQSSYALLGSRIFQMFVDISFVSLRNHVWEDLEATMFCLDALSDCMVEGQEEERQVGRLLDSPEFLSSLDLNRGAPLKLSRAMVDTLGHYAVYFEGHTNHLAAPLRFLFQCLEVATLAAEASRSIGSLCGLCRQVLTSEVEAFINQYERFQNGEAVDASTKNKVLGAIACIIQARDSDEDRARYLARLLAFVGRDVYTCLNYAAAQQLAEAEEAGVVALQSLASIGKGMQAPEDVPIDLDTDTAPSTFWKQGGGARLQSQIVGLVNQVVAALPQSGPIVEAACSVFRSGFAEHSPGPFVFPTQVTAHFILRSNLDTPRLSLILATACALISSHSTDSSARIDEEARALLLHVVGLIYELKEPENDPEIAQGFVDLIARLLHRYIDEINRLPKDVLQATVLFVLKCLAGRDILPKRSAANLWTSLLALHGQPEPAQSAINSIIDQLGPLLAETLMVNFGGNASRSELDTLVEPLKKMVFRHRLARSWLEQALFKDTFPSNKVDGDAKREFLQKIMSLRGAKGTNQVVKEFWVVCRGSSFAYTS